MLEYTKLEPIILYLWEHFLKHKYRSKKINGEGNKLQEGQLGISSASSQHIIKNASHDLTLTVPEELIDAVKKFLSVN